MARFKTKFYTDVRHQYHILANSENDEGSISELDNIDLVEHNNEPSAGDYRVIYSRLI